MTNKIANILNNEYPSELATKLSEIYYNAVCEYKKRNWQYFGNEVGRFIEIAIRIIEFKTEGKYNGLEERLPIFNEKRIKDFEQSSICNNISFKILIPRQLYSMYTIRNKRGMIHINEIDPNYMDATLLINMQKWVLAEFIRNSSQLDYEESLNIIESIIAKEKSLIWIEGDILKILDNSLDLEEKILCILYYENNINEKRLFELSEYSNITRFKKKLQLMHKEQKINYSIDKITISPIGMNIAEQKFNKIGKI